MNVVEVMIISLGLSFDAFVILAYKGTMLARVDKWKWVQTGLVFGVWQFFTIMLGHLLARIPKLGQKSNGISILFPCLSVLIFVGIGVYMLWKAARKEIVFEHRVENISFKEILCLAAATSWDAFFASIGFTFLRTDFVMVALTISIITTCFAILGLHIGYWLGYDHKRSAYVVGGVILIVSGVDVIFRYICLK